MPEGMTRSMLIERPLIALLVLSSVFLQAGVEAAEDARAVATGAWGGEHILLEVSEKGAEAEFDCAGGQITQPITLDKHGGPVRRDVDAPAAPARYSGHVDGHTMSLTVTLGKEKVGFFTLTRGSRPILKKCR
jgi:hypothetical protein